MSQAKTILALFPHARIKLAVYGIHDTDVCDDLRFAVAHFVLGCRWPVNGDRNVNLDEFLSLLRKQAELMDLKSL